MNFFHPKSLFEKVFEGGILIKGIHGVLELLAGILLIFVDPQTIHDFIVFITQKEIIEDPQDLVANTLLHWSNYFMTGGKLFVILYLWIHAIIKLIAVIGILKNYLWAYPFSLVSLGLFMLYQIYEISIHPTFGMIALTIFDIFILWLIWEESKKVRKQN